MSVRRLTAEEAHALWREGDWAQLYPVLRRIAFAAVRDYVHRYGEDVVQDMVQDALTRCVLHIEVPENPHAFVAVVAANIAKDYAKRAVYRRTLPLDNALEVHVPEQEFTADDARFLRSSFMAALNRLQPKHQEILRLRIRDGRSHAECARILGCNEGATKMRLFHAREALQAHWGRVLPPEWLRGRKRYRRAHHHSPLTA